MKLTIKFFDSTKHFACLDEYHRGVFKLTTYIINQDFTGVIEAAEHARRHFKGGVTVLIFSGDGGELPLYSFITGEK